MPSYLDRTILLRVDDRVNLNRLKWSGLLVYVEGVGVTACFIDEFLNGSAVYRFEGIGRIVVGRDVCSGVGQKSEARIRAVSP